MAQPPLLREGGESAFPNRQFGQFCLDRRGRRERLSLIASDGVVDKSIRCLVYHPVCASKEGGLFFMAQTPLLSRRGNLLADRLFSWGIEDSLRAIIYCFLRTSGLVPNPVRGPLLSRSRSRSVLAIEKPVS